MNNNNKINLFISSKNKSINETNNKLSISIPDGLLCVDNDESFKLKIMSFFCYNTLENVNITNYWLRVNNVNYYLPIGNPNVNDIRDDLNNKFSSLNLVLTYDKIKNKFIFSNNSLSSISLVVISCGIFLGLENNTTYSIISNSYIMSVNPLCVISNNSINISLTGDIELKLNNLDTLRNGLIQNNNIIFQKLIDSKTNYIIKYENQGDNLFEYNLSNTDSINYFTVNILNQDLDYIENFPDFYMTLQFEKYKKDEMLSVLSKIREYLFDIINLLFAGLQHFKIL